MMFRLHPRANAAFLAGPILLAIVGLYAASEDVSAYLDGYWESASAQTASAVKFIAPVTAACAAWEAGRLRRARAGSWAPTRNACQIVLASVLPVLLLGTLALCTTLLGVWLQLGSAPGWPNLAILGTALAIVTAHILVGFAVGLWLPTVAAVPTVLIGDYLWGVYPPALEPLWLRHLTVPVASCCDNVFAPDTRAIAASALVAAGLAAVALAAISASHHMPTLDHITTGTRQRLLAIGTTALALCVFGGAVLVDHLGADAVHNRDAKELVCDHLSTGPRVCVWPEHRDRLPETTRSLSQAASQLHAYGVPAPKTISEQNSPMTKDLWLITIRQTPNYTEQDLLAGLAANLTQTLPHLAAPPSASTCASDSTAVDSAISAYQQLEVWLAVRAGIDTDLARARYSPDAWTAVQAQINQTPHRQTEWYKATLAKARCAW
ncbi:hypothetical protein [Streptomyces sp. NPDC091212]|uniref:DUF7224 domain-containing protein n=1 Tax=Streptomyces sp. NPDC091212 TaxID=3155191 RepID=UPI003448C4C6